MNRIEKAFDNKKAFIGFITAGDPTLDKTEEFVLEMERAGASIVELGIPFSDPIAEGPVIQNANIRSLSAGCTTDKIFEMVKSLRTKTQIPLVFMGYVNTLYKYGYEKFFAKCQEVDIDGVILPDVPFEEKGELQPIASKYGIKVISLIAPTSEKRIQMIAKEAEGFIYCVSSLGVTGVRSEINTDIGAMVAHVKTVTDTPVAVGFGISTPEQAKRMAALSDGAIVGSAIVKIVAQYGKDALPHVADYVKKMKAGVSEA